MLLLNLLRLVTYNKFAKLRSIADEFDCTVKGERKGKYMSLYIINKCYSATFILNVLPLLVKGSSIYLEYEFSITKLHTLTLKIIQQMCLSATDSINFSVGRNMDFKSEPRATKLNKLKRNELSGLPTNNLDAERNSFKISLALSICKFL